MEVFVLGWWIMGGLCWVGGLGRGGGVVLSGWVVGGLVLGCWVVGGFVSGWLILEFVRYK